ncbi:MAG TPA: hypothetical protein VGU46_03875 [Acidobacteriaceae bacterium]|nr:hypothetical protein [Acidobacteriaceae bacterium]
MNQIWHIFRKDTRRFWVEILVASLLEFAFVAIYPGRWKVHYDQSQSMRVLQFSSFLSFLVPIGWWLLTVRAVQAEALVGDEQFWITRPYEWKKLLTAKILFIVVWIGVPYLLAQSWLLNAAGFHPLSYIPRLLYGLLMVLAVFGLPALALGTVTSTFVQLTLTLLGGYLVYLGFNFAVTTPGLFPATHPYPNKVLPVLLMAGCAAAIWLQYARRRTRVARTILLVTPLLMALSVVFYNRSSRVDEAYPQNAAGAAAPVVLSLATTPEEPVKTQAWDGLYHLNVPVHYTGVQDGQAVSFDDMRFTITSADGRQWSSPWQAVRYIRRILPTTNGVTLELSMKPEVYDRFKSGPVTVQVTFATTRYQADSITRTTVPTGDAAIPGVGFCTPRFRQMPNLYCRAAIQAPRLTYATLMWSSDGCSDPAHLYNPAAQGSAWIGGEEAPPALSAVWTNQYWTGFRENDELRKLHADWQICPGSPLTLTPYHWLGTGQTGLTLTNFTFPASPHIG